MEPIIYYIIAATPGTNIIFIDMINPAAIGTDEKNFFIVDQLRSILYYIGESLQHLEPLEPLQYIFIFYCITWKESPIIL